MTDKKPTRGEMRKAIEAHPMFIGMSGDTSSGRLGFKFGAKFTDDTFTLYGIEAAYLELAETTRKALAACNGPAPSFDEDYEYNAKEHEQFRAKCIAYGMAIGDSASPLPPPPLTRARMRRFAQEVIYGDAAIEALRMATKQLEEDLENVWEAAKKAEQLVKDTNAAWEAAKAAQRKAEQDCENKVFKCLTDNNIVRSEALREALIAQELDEAGLICSDAG